MSMAAGAAVLRSLATKMGRASPRLPYALDRHGRLPTSSGGLCLPSRFSTSTGGSMPNLRDTSQNKNVPGQLHSAKESAPMPAGTKVLCWAAVGTSAVFYGWVKTRFEAFSEELIFLRKAVEECQRTHIKARDDPSHQSQITQALGEAPPPLPRSEKPSPWQPDSARCKDRRPYHENPLIVMPAMLVFVTVFILILE